MRLRLWIGAAAIAASPALAAAGAWGSNSDARTFQLLAPVAALPVVWLAASLLIGALSGWYTLAGRYPDTREAALVRLGFRSGAMGRFWVHMGGILTLEACASGLRVSIWRVFAPWCRPFLVPWAEVSAQPINYFLRPMSRLDFGQPPVGTLRIDARSWDVLSAAARPTAGSAVATTPPVTDAHLALNALLQWLVGTLLVAAFFYAAPRFIGPAAPQLPLAICIGLPAVVVGIGAVAQFLLERRRT